MSRLHLAASPYRVRFKRPLVTARETYRYREGWFITLRDAEGQVGYGEVAPLPCFGTETMASAEAALLRLARTGVDGTAMDASIVHLPATRAGLDLALLDYQARRSGRSLASAFSPNPAGRIPIQKLLARQDAEELADEAASAIADGFATLKIKVGAATLDTDRLRVMAVRDRVGPGCRLRLDANGAWDEATALEAIASFTPFDVDLLEQPVDTSDPGVFQRLRGRGIPIAADEALTDSASARALLETEAVDALVLKPTVIGGLSVAHALAKEALESGIRVIVTSALERELGVCAALHLATALPVEPCGLGTLGLMEMDVPEALQPQDGRLMVPSGPGLGLFPATTLEGSLRC